LLFWIKKENNLFLLEGVLGAPMAQRRDTRGMIFFINNRLVADKKLIMAVKTAFRSLIEIGYHPICALKIDIAPDEIDVNIHPRKAEVRFRDERSVISNVIHELGDFLAKTPWLFASKDQKNTVDILPKYDKTYENYRGVSLATTGLPLSKSSLSFDQKNEILPHVVKEDVQSRLLSSANFSSLRVVGQIASTYLLTESETALVIIDQHAAHERVMYERILKQKDHRTSTMPLLIPITLYLDASFMSLFEEYKVEIREIGIDAEIFGENNIVIRSLPDFIREINAQAFMEAILSDLLNYGQLPTVADLFHHLCATLACHSSIRAGQILTKEEIENLLRELDGIDFSAHCPHGRPIVKSISTIEMKKWFDRS
jgi:DNA mismatch repair protein MutL